MTASPERAEPLRDHLTTLAAEMRANSERWFPEMHAHPVVPMYVFYSMGLAGEAGEQLDVVKKSLRQRHAQSTEPLGAELADVFTYLLLLAHDHDIDLMAEYRRKVIVNESRWGAQPTT